MKWMFLSIAAFLHRNMLIYGSLIALKSNSKKLAFLNEHIVSVCQIWTAYDFFYVLNFNTFTLDFSGGYMYVSYILLSYSLFNSSRLNCIPRFELSVNCNIDLSAICEPVGIPVSSAMNYNC